MKTFKEFITESDAFRYRSRPDTMNKLGPSKQVNTVAQYDKEGKFVALHRSMREAHRAVVNPSLTVKDSAESEKGSVRIKSAAKRGVLLHNHYWRLVDNDGSHPKTINVS